MNRTMTVIPGDVIATGDRTTKDLGAEYGTSDFTNAVLNRLS